MKKIFLAAALALGVFTSFTTQAQVRFSIQIGAPVMRQTWCNYDDDYYYMPDYGVYYNVSRRVYVYPEEGNWVYAPALPARYGGCNFESARYYRIRERAPFRRDDFYRNQYGMSYNNGGYHRGNGYGRGGWDRDGRRFEGRDHEFRGRGNGGWQGGGGATHIDRR